MISDVKMANFLLGDGILYSILANIIFIGNTFPINLIIGVPIVILSLVLSITGLYLLGSHKNINQNNI